MQYRAICAEIVALNQSARLQVLCGDFDKDNAKIVNQTIKSINEIINKYKPVEFKKQNKKLLKDAGLSMVAYKTALKDFKKELESMKLAFKKQKSKKA